MLPIFRKQANIHNEMTKKKAAEKAAAEQKRLDELKKKTDSAAITELTNDEAEQLQKQIDTEK